MQKEIWKDIVGYEGMYEVSSFGRVRSLDRRLRNGRLHTGSVLKTRIARNGYELVSMYADGMQKTDTVHRIMAQAFIPNPDNLPQINHKDENKANNAVDNLEWCDSAYNNNYGNHIRRIMETESWKPNLEKALATRPKSVLCLNQSGDIVSRYESARAAAKELGINPSNISACCLGKQKSAKGFTWKYDI